MILPHLLFYSYSVQDQNSSLSPHDIDLEIEAEDPEREKESPCAHMALASRFMRDLIHIPRVTEYS